MGVKVLNKLALFSWIPVILGALLTASGIAPIAGVCLWACGVALQFIIGGTFLYKKFVIKRL